MACKVSLELIVRVDEYSFEFLVGMEPSVV